MNKNVIAIDGHASTGKSTLAKRLAKRLGCLYMDTGYMFRVMAFLGIESGYITQDSLDEVALMQEVSGLQFSWTETPKGVSMAFNGKVYGDEIRTEEVSPKVSQVAALKSIRDFLLQQQRALAQDHTIIMDGRDIGTVVFPDAQFKFFMTAEAEIRAKRRHEELLSNGIKSDFQTVLNNVITRDQQDASRSIAPLRKAEDAIEINTGHLTVEEVEQLMLQHLR